jgi:siroheme synthase-like protein
VPYVLPVVLKLAGRRVVVVGGGTVAARRLDELARAGAHVTLVDREPGEEVRRRLDAGVPGTLHRRDYREGDAEGATVVFAATGSRSLDERVARDARAHGALVHVADDPELCDLYLTAVHRRGPVVVSISSSGTSPALASWLRDRVAAMVGPEFERAASLLARARGALRAQRGSSEGAGWTELLDGGLVEELRAGDDAAAERRLARFLEAHA